MQAFTGIIDTAQVPVDKRNVLRYAGHKGNAVPQAISDIMEDAIRDCREISCLKYIYKIFPADDCPVPVYGDKLTRLLEGSDRLAFFILTAGPAVEKRIERCFAEGSFAYGMMLDAAATELVEGAADLLEGIIKKEAGGPLTSRFSPGYGEWDLSVQPHILKHLDGAAIGVSLNDSLFLIPRKTITAVIGLGGHSKKPSNPCEGCGLECTYRKETAK